MAGRNVDADPVFYPRLNRHELIREDSVVSAHLIVRVHVQTEGNQVVSGSLQRGALVQLLDHLLDLKELKLVEHIHAL